MPWMKTGAGMAAILLLLRPMNDERRGSLTASVLCVDDDRDVAEVVQAILEDEGYAVSCLYELADDAFLRAVGRLEPDVILLDNASTTDYGGSWELATAITHRRRPVPVFSYEARLASGQSRQAIQFGLGF